MASLNNFMTEGNVTQSLVSNLGKLKVLEQ